MAYSAEGRIRISGNKRPERNACRRNWYGGKSDDCIFQRIKKEDTITVEAAFEADYTITRRPADNPIIQGMYEAKKNLKTEKEKDFAEECIQGYLTEMNATYQVTERYPTTVIVKFNTKDKPEDYELFYDLVSEGKSNLVPFRQYAMENWKENVQERRQMGKEVLLENVEIDMENLKNQN